MMAIDRFFIDKNKKSTYAKKLHRYPCVQGRCNQGGQGFKAIAAAGHTLNMTTPKRATRLLALARFAVLKMHAKNGGQST